jgi:hypothetical protein
VATPESAAHVATSEATSHVTAAEATAHVAAAEATSHVAAPESPAHVATPESTTHVAASQSATVPGGLGVRPHCYAERDGGEEGHGRACGALLRNALNEVHGVASTICSGRCQDVFHFVTP